MATSSNSQAAPSSWQHQEHAIKDKHHAPGLVKSGDQHQERVAGRLPGTTSQTLPQEAQCHLAAGPHCCHHCPYHPRVLIELQCPVRNCCSTVQPTPPIPDHTVAPASDSLQETIQQQPAHAPHVGTLPVHSQVLGTIATQTQQHTPLGQGALQVAQTLAAQ
jgi:hypothetical protein